MNSCHPQVSAAINTTLTQLGSHQSAVYHYQGAHHLQYLNSYFKNSLFGARELLEICSDFRAQEVKFYSKRPLWNQEQFPEQFPLKQKVSVVDGELN